MATKQTITTKLSPSATSADPKTLVMKKQVRIERNEKADKEFFASVKKHGVRMPILVRIVNNAFEVVAGHRRTEAAIEAGLTSVPIKVDQIADSEVLTIQMIENIQREGLSLLDTARGVKALHEGPGGGLATYTAERLGKSNGWVSKMLLVAGGDKANPGATITQKLLTADKIGDLESAYMLTKLEEINPVAAQEVADNIENETRASIKRRLEKAKPVKAAKKGDQTPDEEDNIPMYRWMLKVIEAASVSRKDQPLQAAAVEMLQGWISEGEQPPV